MSMWCRVISPLFLKFQLCDIRKVDLTRHCKLFTGRTAAMQQTAGIKFTHRPKIRFFAPHWFTSNMAWMTGNWVRLAVQIFTSICTRWCECGPNFFREIAVQNCEKSNPWKSLCAPLRRDTVKLRIEAPGFYQYKWVRPPACMRGPASIRGPACIITCDSKNRQLSYLPGISILFIFTLKHRILRRRKRGLQSLL